MIETYKPNQLFRPIHHLGYSLPDPKASYELFDRVVNIRSGISVPLGAKGTIIGKNIDTEKEVNTLYDILFDEEFVGGTKLRCSAGKGYKLSPANLINITYGLKISGKLKQFMITGQPLQSKPQPNRQNNYQQNNRQQNYPNFQFDFGFGQRMPRPRFPTIPPFSIMQNMPVIGGQGVQLPMQNMPTQPSQTAISIQTLNHSKTSPFQSPKHETKNEDFPPMEQLWNALTEMQTNNKSLPKSSFAEITAQNRSQNLSVNQREGTDRNKTNSKVKNQKNPENKRYENVGQSYGQNNNKANKNNIQLIESFRQILVKACAQYYKQSPKFEIIKMGPLESKSIKLILPDNQTFYTLMNNHESTEDAYEDVSHQGLKAINNTFNANINLIRSERLLSLPSFVVPNQSSPNRPRIPESVLPRPPSNWFSQPKPHPKPNPRPEIPESFPEHNERLLREIEKIKHSSRVNTNSYSNKDRNIQPKKLFDTRNDNIVNVNTNQKSSQNRNNRKIQNDMSYDNSSAHRRLPRQTAFDNQFVPLQVARNNQSHKTTPHKSSAQKSKESKTLIEINSTSSEEVDILTPESIKQTSNPNSKNSKDDEIEILTPDSLRQTTGRRSTSRKARLGVNLN